MYDYQKQSDPARNTQFGRRWAQTRPPNKRERRLSELRAKHGNILGQEIFVVELRELRAAGLI